jgi:hypothetical protein
MAVTEKVSESMNIFTGNSRGTNNLVELLADDQHMIYTMTGERVNQLLSIKHKPRKGPG